MLPDRSRGTQFLRERVVGRDGLLSGTSSALRQQRSSEPRDTSSYGLTARIVPQLQIEAREAEFITTGLISRNPSSRLGGGSNWAGAILGMMTSDTFPFGTSDFQEQNRSNIAPPA